MDYHPIPVDTSHIELQPDLVELIERLAKNVHDLWARKRIADGWSYGEFRDDRARHHPCLVPYQELPESEKAYDRETATQTLKLILELGYQIQKNVQAEHVQ